MKNQIILIVLCLIMVISMCACGTEPLPTETTTPTTIPTEPKGPNYISAKDEYTYYYTEGRNLRWEEDLIYFANSHFTDNQILEKGLFLVQLPGSRTDAASFYDEAFTQSVRGAINDLIPKIENLTDEEILWQIQRIAAMFDDAHTSVYLDESKLYPAFFMPMNEDGKWVFYAVCLPEAHKKLLYNQLTAINGHPIDEVIDRMRSFLSHENEYGFIASLGYGAYGNEYLSLPMALEATGISQLNDKKVTYTLLDADGNTHDLVLQSVKDTGSITFSGVTLANATPVPYAYDSNEHYWHYTDETANTLYIRISSFAYEETQSYLDFSGALTIEGNNHGYYEKVIVDLRGNRGGHQAEGWRAIVNSIGRVDTDAVYLLVDSCTYSCSMLFAAEVKEIIPDVIIAGTPTGEAPGFFAGIYESDYFMPNCGVEFTVPTQYYQPFPANEENALMPDLLIWPTIEDYRECRDTVLEAVMKQ